MSGDTSFGPVFEVSGGGSTLARWGRSVALTWAFFISLGVLVFEVTANPLLGALVVCMKFGLKDVLTAMWATRDPHRARGLAVCWFFVAHGFYKIGLFGVLLIVTNAVLARLGINNVAVQDQQVLLAISFVAIGFIVGYASAAQGAGVACNHRLHLWLDPHLPTLHQRRFQSAGAFGEKNILARIIVLSCVLSLLFMTLFGTGLCAFAVRFVNQPPIPVVANERAWLLVLIVATLFLVLRFAGAFVRQREVLNLAATAPEECWPEMLDVKRDDAR